MTGSEEMRGEVFIGRIWRYVRRPALPFVCGRRKISHGRGWLMVKPSLRWWLAVCASEFRRQREHVLGCHPAAAREATSEAFDVYCAAPPHLNVAVTEDTIHARIGLARIGERCRDVDTVEDLNGCM